VTYTVPYPASISVNGVILPPWDIRTNLARNLVEQINALTECTAALDLWGRISITNPAGPVTIGGDPGVRAVFGI
jgi:hypothetical protein